MMHGHTLDIIDVHGELGIVTGLLVKTNTFIPSVAEATMFMCKNAFLHSCLEQLIANCLSAWMFVVLALCTCTDHNLSIHHTSCYWNLVTHFNI